MSRQRKPGWYKKVTQEGPEIIAHVNAEGLHMFYVELPLRRYTEELMPEEKFKKIRGIE